MYSNSSLKARTALGSLTPCLSIIRSICAMYDLRKPLKFRVLFIACEEQELIKEDLNLAKVNLNGFKNTRKMTKLGSLQVNVLIKKLLN